MYTHTELNHLKKTRGFKVLLVEDNPGDIRLIEETLKESPFLIDLDFVQNGVDALNYLYKREKYKDASSPDLILLDLNIPKKNGKEILKDIKNNEQLKKIPVIVLTISQAEDDILECYNLHANCYIQKPLQMESFVYTFNVLGQFWLSTVTLPPREIVDAK